MVQDDVVGAAVGVLHQRLAGHGVHHLRTRGNGSGPAAGGKGVSGMWGQGPGRPGAPGAALRRTPASHHCACRLSKAAQPPGRCLFFAHVPPPPGRARLRQVDGFEQELAARQLAAAGQRAPEGHERIGVALLLLPRLLVPPALELVWVAPEGRRPRCCVLCGHGAARAGARTLGASPAAAGRCLRPRPGLGLRRDQPPGRRPQAAGAASS